MAETTDTNESKPLATGGFRQVPERCDELFTAVVPNGRVFCKASTAVLNEEDEVFAELSVSGFRGKIEDHRIFRLFFLPRIHALDGRAAALTSPGGNTYYHWLFDLLPRLEILRLAGIPLESVDFFLVNGCSRPYQKETLERLEIRHKAVSLEQHPHVKASELIAPSFAGNPPHVPQWICEFLRKTFLTEDTLTETGKQKKIYVSRAKAKHRRVINEEDVRRMLESAGFMTVFLEDMSFKDQVNLFARAETVVGLHGSGFSNLVFCRTGARVVEIFSHHSAPPYYRNISKCCGLDYTALMGEKPDRSFAGSTKQTENVLVDLARLKEMIK